MFPTTAMLAILSSLLLSVANAQTIGRSGPGIRRSAKLAAGAIVGIVIGIVVFWILVCLCVFMCIRRRRARSQGTTNMAQPPMRTNNRRSFPFMGKRGREPAMGQHGGGVLATNGYPNEPAPAQLRV